LREPLFARGAAVEAALRPSTRLTSPTASSRCYPNFILGPAVVLTS
jgi:hypothetical protein